MAILKNWWFRYALGLLILLGCHMGYAGYFTRLPISSLPADSKPEVVQACLEAFWQGKPAEQDPLLNEPGLCWVTGFRGGYPEIQQLSLWDSRDAGLRRLLAEPRLREMEAVEVGVATNLTVYNHEPIERDQTGLWGLLLRCSSGDLCLVPCDFPRRSQFPDGQSMKYMNERTVLRQGKFQALTWALRHDAHYRPSLIVRGETVVSADSMSREAIAKAASEAAGFEQRMVERHEGLLPFSYRLATGQTSEEERCMTRLSLGSLSLASYARLTGRDEDRKISERHLKTMMARFGHRFEDKCYISDSESYQLGPQALFALALRTQPTAPKELEEFERGLARVLVTCLQSDGHFLTGGALPGTPAKVALDPEKDENQNVFPGMALAYLARRSQEGSAIVDSETLDRSLLYYQTRFRRRPDRAAIPWLTEALGWRFRQNQERATAESVFSLADWNLSNLQEWSLMEPQVRGGLINPDRLQYGRYCYTYDVGAQLQGLVAAYRVAHSLPDASRIQRYGVAIQEMSRYLRQMQVRDRGDLYWLPPPLRAAPVGGLRDAPWNSNLQIDSTAGALNAWAAWLFAGS